MWYQLKVSTPSMQIPPDMFASQISHWVKWSPNPCIRAWNNAAIPPVIQMYHKELLLMTSTLHLPAHRVLRLTIMRQSQSTLRSFWAKLEVPVSLRICNLMPPFTLGTQPQAASNIWRTLSAALNQLLLLKLTSFVSSFETWTNKQSYAFILLWKVCAVYTC